MLGGGNAGVGLQPRPARCDKTAIPSLAFDSDIANITNLWYAGSGALPATAGESLGR